MKIKFHVSPRLAILHGNEQFGSQTIDLDLASLSIAQRNLLPPYLKNNHIDLTEFKDYYEIPALTEKTALQTLDLILVQIKEEEDEIVQKFLAFLGEFTDLDFSSKEADEKCDRLVRITAGMDKRSSSVVVPFLEKNPQLNQVIDEIIMKYDAARLDLKLKKEATSKANKQKLEDWVKTSASKLIKDRMELGFDYEEIAAKTEFEQRLQFLDLPKFDNRDYTILSQYNRTKPSQLELDVFRRAKEELKDKDLSLCLVRFKYRHNDDVDNEYTATTELEISGLDLLGIERSAYFWIKEEELGF